MNSDDKKFIEAVGQLIREARTRQGISSTELAKRLGMKSPSHLTRIERGEVEARLSTFKLICQELSVDAAELMYEAHERALKSE